MPAPKPNPEHALKQLGERLRDGAAQQPVPERSKQTVRDAVREQYEKEIEQKRKQSEPEPPGKSRSRERDEPDIER